MPRLASLVLAATLCLPWLAAAQAPATTFGEGVTYQSCSESFVFACGMRDASGRTYGTAHPRTICTRYVFATDGRLTVEAMPGVVDSTGRYRVEGHIVHMELRDERGRVRHRETLTLADDGQTLGELTRVPAPPL